MKECEYNNSGGCLVVSQAQTCRYAARAVQHQSMSRCANCGSQQGTFNFLHESWVGNWLITRSAGTHWVRRPLAIGHAASSLSRLSHSGGLQTKSAFKNPVISFARRQPIADTRFVQGSRFSEPNFNKIYR